VPASTSDTSPSAARLHKGSGPTGKRILLAEDDAALRALIHSALARDGHLVTEAADGNQALDLLGASLAGSAEAPPFDLVVSDVRMAGCTGLDLLAGMRHHPDAPPILLMTAFGDDDLHADAGRLGAVATLDKPFDVDDLRALIRTTLCR
jgi:DNA-binding response OmpR family regulator